MGLETWAIIWLAVIAAFVGYLLYFVIKSYR